MSIIDTLDEKGYVLTEDYHSYKNQDLFGTIFFREYSDNMICIYDKNVLSEIIGDVDIDQYIDYVKKQEKIKNRDKVLKDLGI